MVEVELVTQRIVMELQGLGTVNRFAVCVEPADELFPFGPVAAASGVVNDGFRPFSGASDSVPTPAPPILNPPSGSMA